MSLPLYQTHAGCKKSVCMVSDANIRLLMTIARVSGYSGYLDMFGGRPTLNIFERIAADARY